VTGVAYPVDGGMTAALGIRGEGDEIDEETQKRLFEQLSAGVPDASKQAPTTHRRSSNHG
jgi:hypothetical protein